MFRLIAYAALGPITGPLVAGVVRHHRSAPLLAGLYGLALALWAVDAPAVLHALLAYVGGHL